MQESKQARTPELAAAEHRSRNAAATAGERAAFVDARASSAQLSKTMAIVDASPRVLAQRRVADTVNATGLPDQLKTGVESLSGMSLDHVKVRYNSSRPAQLQAHAFAQGSEIHVGPGQERHLPHEAWHVVQQARGRVRPTMEMDGVAVNDDHALEHEADVMGAKAMAARAGHDGPALQAGATPGAPVLQGAWIDSSGVPLPEEGVAMARAEPLLALVHLGAKIGMDEAAQALQASIQAAIGSGNTKRVEEVNTGLRGMLQENTAHTIAKLLGHALDYLTPPDDSMVDPEHDEDAGGGNAEEELEQGDLELGDIERGQQIEIANALIGRSPELYQQFVSLAQPYGRANDIALFLEWFNRGVITRSQARQLFSAPVQRARTPNSESYKDTYPTSLHGTFTQITYKLDGVGSINFDAPKSHAKGGWKNPVKAKSEVQLTTGSSNKTHGITLSGKKVKIVGASRGTHFSIANRIMKNGFGSQSPTNWTWHHLVSNYKMVLVDRKVHAKHGHNGGVHVWK
jgi:hypothetical protein